MDDTKLINIGKAIVDMIEKIKSGNVKGTSLENNTAFFKLEDQIYRLHLSKLEDPIIYSRGVAVKDESEVSNEGEKEDGKEV